MKYTNNSSTESYRQSVKDVSINETSTYSKTTEVVSSEDPNVPETIEDYDIENVDFDEIENDLSLQDPETAEMKETTHPEKENSESTTTPSIPPLSTGEEKTEAGTSTGDASSNEVSASTSGTNSNTVLAEEIRYDLPEDMTIEVDGKEYDPLTLTDEDLEALIGQMTQEEYDALIEQIIAYYKKNLDYYGEMLGNVNDLIEDLENSDIEQYLHLYRLQEFNMHGAISTFVLNYPENDLDKLGVADEFPNWSIDYKCQFFLDLFAKREYKGDDFDSLTTEEKLELCKNSSRYDASDFAEDYEIFYMHNKAIIDQRISEEFGDKYGIYTYEDYVREMDGLLTYKGQLEDAIKTTNNMIDSAPYDYLPYLKEYNDFEYLEDEFLELLLKTGSQELLDLREASEAFPQFERIYYYLYKTKGKKEANEFLKKCKYEINNVRGQVWANNFLRNLSVKDGNGDETLEAIANELEISVQGLEDGLDSFFAGGVYTIEALLTSLGILPENRTMSANEYKKMYILQALFSQEEKEALGLIEKDPTTGEWKNAGNSVIDYTKEYSGGALLKHTYQITQGIGNMLPSIALAAVCPLAGSIAMGVSAGGNAYHNAMVEGHSLASSIMYGIFTGASESISEYILGGLPFLSKSKVSGFLSYLGAAGKEGFQEIFQGLMDLTYQYAYMGKELPQTEEEWKKELEDLKWQGIYGALTAGILNIGPLVSSIRHNHTINSFLNQNNITQEQYKNALLELRNSNPAFADLSDAELKAHYTKELMRRAMIQQTAANNNVTAKAAEIMLALNVDADVASYMAKTNCSLIEALDVCETITREFLEAYMKDPNLEVPKGVPEDVVKYLEAIRNNEEITAPMELPKAIQEFVRDQQNAEDAKYTKAYDDAVSSVISQTLPLLLEGTIDIPTLLKDAKGTPTEQLALLNTIMEKIAAKEMKASDIKAIKDFYNSIHTDNFTMMVKKAQMEAALGDLILQYRVHSCVDIENILTAYVKENPEKFPNFRMKASRKYGIVVRADNLEPNSTYKVVYEYLVPDPTTGQKIKQTKEIVIKVNNTGAGFIQDSYEINYTDSNFIENCREATIVEIERVEESFDPYAKPNEALISDAGYGVSQSSLSEVSYIEGLKAWEDIYYKLLSGEKIDLSAKGKEIVDLVKSYIPGLSDSAAIQYLHKINSEGACSYADVANQIVIQFADNPGLFKQIFGYDLFVTTPEGKKTINAELLLADLYTFSNWNNNELFKDRFLLGKKYINPETHHGQNYMTDSHGFHKKAIQAFFDYKVQQAGLSDSVDVKVDTSVLTSNMIQAPLYTPEQMYTELQSRLSSGVGCSIGVYVDTSKNQKFKMYVFNPETKVHDIPFSSDMWFSNDILFEAGIRTKKTAGHAMAITQVTTEGMYVESWGRSFFLPFSELENIGFTIRDMNIGINNK